MALDRPTQRILQTCFIPLYQSNHCATESYDTIMQNDIDSVDLNDELRVGCRVVIGHRHIATIRFVGPIQGQDGEWVGIEWDDPSRGKHDGTHDGIRYFRCLRHPAAGSFIRKRKLAESVEKGKDLSEALQEKYEEENEEDLVEQDGAVMIRKGKGNRSEKQQQDERTTKEGKDSKDDDDRAVVRADGSLRVASCAGMRVCSTAPSCNVRLFLEGVETLDLSDNLLWDWREVVALVKALPMLQTLDLSGNKFDVEVPPNRKGGDTRNLGNMEASSVISECCIAWDSNLRELVLNRCGLTWSGAICLAGSLPSIRSLYLCENKIQGFDLLEPKYISDRLPQLELLDLSMNELTTWYDIAVALGKLATLQVLLLTGNMVSEISYDAVNPFSSLLHLGLGNNNIQSWESVNQLDLFPSLRELRLSGNPITVDNPTAKRYDIIVRMGKLRMLNGSIVHPSERHDAELNYVRRAVLRYCTDNACRDSNGLRGKLERTNEPSAAAGDEIAMTKEDCMISNLMKDGRADLGMYAESAEPLLPRRLQALLHQYQDIVQTTSVESRNRQKARTLQSNTVELSLVAGTRIIRKRIPSTLAVNRLKPLLEKLLHVKILNQRVLLIPPEGVNRFIEDITDENTKDIRYFDVQDGWKIEVVADDAVPQAANNERLKNASAARQYEAEERHEALLQRLRDEEEKIMTIGKE